MTKHMEQIIKKAISGGWFFKSHQFDEFAVLDPLFWQALGKVCGWEGKVEMIETWKKVPEFHIEREVKVGEVDTWKHYALRFHEINLTEGFDKAVEYLTNLTTPTNDK